jgi:hypothetical protein
MKIVKIKTGEYGKKPLSKVRMFVYSNAEAANPLVDFMTGGRYKRPHQAYRKEVLPLVLIDLMIASNTKVTWSQKAGCSCGCSPGFILDIHPAKTGFEAIWVTVK